MNARRVLGLLYSAAMAMSLAACRAWEAYGSGWILAPLAAFESVPEV
jgi:hypothetical protein